MEINIVTNINDKVELEKLRRDVLHLDRINQYYSSVLLTDREFAVAATIGDELVGGCYFHRLDETLMIDQLFVKEEYQNTGMRIGRNILEALFNKKEELEKLFGEKVTVCRIESDNEKAHAIYSKMGFRESSTSKDTFYKSM